MVFFTNMEVKPPKSHKKQKLNLRHLRIGIMKYGINKREFYYLKQEKMKHFFSIVKNGNFIFSLCLI